MANNFFKFRQFTVFQDRCAMKVGTDGTLLGAWARGGDTILDIGTGTGLIALMLAQRYPQAQVKGIDIVSSAVEQARENVEASPFRNIVIEEADAVMFANEGERYHSIVCNPPFYEGLACPDGLRNVARHTTLLSFRSLVESVVRLLRDDGEFSVIVPFDSLSRLENEASLSGLFKTRQCSVRTTPGKSPRRFLLAFRKHPCELETEDGVVELSPGVRSEWYQQLTKDFYL